MKKLFYVCIASIGIMTFSSCSSLLDDEEQAKEKFIEDQKEAPAPPVIAPTPAPAPKKKGQADKGAGKNGGNDAESEKKAPGYTSGATHVDSGLAISVTTIGNGNKFTLTVNSGQNSSSHGSSSVGSEQNEPLWQPFQFPTDTVTPSINMKKKGTVVQDGFVIITDDQSAQAVFGKKSEAEVATLDE